MRLDTDFGYNEYRHKHRYFFVMHHDQEVFVRLLGKSIEAWCAANCAHRYSVDYRCSNLKTGSIVKLTFYDVEDAMLFKMTRSWPKP